MALVNRCEMISPQSRGRRKSAYSEADEARAIAHAVWTLRGTRLKLPLVWGQKIIGTVWDDPANRRTLWIPKHCARPYSSQDAAISASTSGQVWQWQWYKAVSVSVVLNNWFDTWPIAGNPQAGAYGGTARTARQFNDATTGAMFHGGNVSPKNKYLARSSAFRAVTTTNTSYIVQDRVLSYDGCTMTASSQTMTNTLPAQRYITSGPGLQIGCYADAVHSATAANLSALTFTDNGGNLGQSIQLTPTLVKTPSIGAPTAVLGARAAIETPGIAHNGLPYLDNGGKEGAEKIEAYTWSAAPTGTVSFFLAFPLFMSVDMQIIGQCADAEFVAGVDALGKQIYDGACLNVLYTTDLVGASQVYGEMEVLWL
jgi:hypothetical protein